MKWSELRVGDWLFDDHAQFSEQHNWIIVKIEGDMSWWMNLDSKVYSDESLTRRGDVPLIYTIIRGDQILQKAMKRDV